MALAGALALPLPVAAQSTRAGVVTALDGTATVARTNTPEARPLSFKDDVFARDMITTGDRSIARILLGGKALITIRERSVLAITETSTTSTIELTSGRIALAVAKSRMRPGDSVQIRTPNAVAGIRGTVVIAEVAQNSTRFTLVTGVIDVTQLDRATQLPIGPARILHPLQTIAVEDGQAPDVPRTITKVEADALSADFTVEGKRPPAAAPGVITETQMKVAVEHATSLATGQAAPVQAAVLPATDDDTATAAPSSDDTGAAVSASPSASGPPAKGIRPASGAAAPGGGAGKVSRGDAGPAGGTPAAAAGKAPAGGGLAVGGAVPAGGGGGPAGGSLPAAASGAPGLGGGGVPGAASGAPGLGGSLPAAAGGATAPGGASLPAAAGGAAALGGASLPAAAGGAAALGGASLPAAAGGAAALGGATLPAAAATVPAASGNALPRSGGGSGKALSQATTAR